MSSPTGERQEELLSEAVGLLIAARHPRVEQMVLDGLPEPFVAEFYAARESLAALGLALPPEEPPAGLRARILGSVAARPRSRSALLVVDMLMDHLNPGGALEVPRARLIVPALRARIEAARSEGTPVVYVVDEHDPDDPDLEAWGAHNVKGTGGNDVWPEIAPDPGDHVVKKPSYSAFVGSELEQVLDGLRVDSLVLTGCLTEIQLFTTATDALQRGYAVDIPADTQAGAAEQFEQTCLATVRLMAPFGPARKARLARLAAAA